ncbi:unnamed protein product [Lampetra planeri]
MEHEVVAGKIPQTKPQGFSRMSEKERRDVLAKVPCDNLKNPFTGLVSNGTEQEIKNEIVDFLRASAQGWSAAVGMWATPVGQHRFSRMSEKERRAVLAKVPCDDLKNPFTGLVSNGTEQEMKNEIVDFLSASAQAACASDMSALWKVRGVSASPHLRAAN